MVTLFPLAPPNPHSSLPYPDHHPDEDGYYSANAANGQIIRRSNRTHRKPSRFIHQSKKNIHSNFTKTYLIHKQIPNPCNTTISRSNSAHTIDRPYIGRYIHQLSFPNKSK